MGDDYMRPIYDFEISKNNEINNYIRNHASPKCVRIMHEKLLTFMKFMIRHNKGTMPFTYGEDVNKDMTYEEL